MVRQGWDPELDIEIDPRYGAAGAQELFVQDDLGLLQAASTGGVEAVVESDAIAVVDIPIADE